MALEQAFLAEWNQQVTNTSVHTLLDLFSFPYEYFPLTWVVMQPILMLTWVTETKYFIAIYIFVF